MSDFSVEEIRFLYFIEKHYGMNIKNECFKRRKGRKIDVELLNEILRELIPIVKRRNFMNKTET
jgi:hypothetical protein